MKSLLLLLVLAFVAVANAGVVVHKSFKERFLIKGKNATIVISAFNKGPDAIHNFVVEDSTFRNLTTYAPVAGKHSRLFKTIEVNQSASFWFVVRPTVAGTHSDQPASYRYKDSNQKQHNGFSSFYQAFPVFTEQEAAKLGLKTQNNNKWPILAVAFGAVAVFVGYVYQEVQQSEQAEKVVAADDDQE
ncbi:UNVERIFIED_CONTAM: hypothetical protein HDU68_008665 [Siphonaria sp. JEL0065]|nr:hypothetical protein HDU68_008665 [Siphonaria sp. JEL0065]